MQIEMLEEFITFARHLNFSRAAAELHVSQSTLSKHVADMERELGFSLVRRGRVLTLTQEGQIMLECAQQTVKDYKNGVQKCKGAKPIRLKWFTNSRNDSYDNFLRTCSTFPLSFVSPNEIGEEPYFSALRRDLVDVVAIADMSFDHAFVERASDFGVSVVPIGRFPAALALSKNHPLASSKTLALSAIRQYEFVVPSGSYFKLYSKAISHALGDDLDLHFVIKPIYSEMENLSRMDFGAAILFYTESTIRNLLGAREDIAIRTELDGKPLYIDHGILCRSEEANPLVTEFIESFKHFCAE